MSAEDRRHWDSLYGDAAPAAPALPHLFAVAADILPTSGRALDIACGTGAGAVWLAARGLDVTGIDVSTVALRAAGDLAAAAGVSQRCRFVAADLDHGLPAGPPVDVVMCHLFRDPGLYGPMAARLAPGGILAVACLSEVGAAPSGAPSGGRFRAPAGELRRAFPMLSLIDGGEGGGRAWLVARRDGA